MHNQTDYILINKRWHSSILEVRSLRGADCNTGHYLVAEKLWRDWHRRRERLEVSKQAAQKFDVERFNLRKLS